jgi:DNA-binding GntR family transcriptional regulator
MIDPDSGVPVHRQLADIIRDQIAGGELVPGQRLRTEPEYMDEYDLGRNVVRQAMSALRAEGLIVTTRQGSKVRVPHDLAERPINRDDRVTTRMPTEAERRRYGLAEGVPLLVVEREGGQVEILPGDRTALRGQ